MDVDLEDQTLKLEPLVRKDEQVILVEACEL